MSNCQSGVIKIYQSVIDDVISGVRDSFLDEGVDEQVLQELKQIWESKLEASKAIEVEPPPPVHQPPVIIPQNEVTRNIVTTRPAQMANTIYTFQSTQNAIKNLPQQANQINQSAIRPQVLNSQPKIIQQSQQHTQQQTPIQPQHQVPRQQTPNSLSLSSQTVIVADPNKQVPIQLTLQGQGGGERVLTIQVPASALQGNQLQQILTGPLISATMALPVNVASSLLQQHVSAAFQNQASSMAQLQPVTTVHQAIASHQQQNQTGNIGQLDGAVDTSDEDDDDEDEDNEDDDDDDDENEENEDENEEEHFEGAEEEPLNSEDDVSDEDPTDLFDTDNVVVCQYDKITRSRNKWKFYLKDGIMNLNGKDFVFQKASGDAEW